MDNILDRTPVRSKIEDSIVTFGNDNWTVKYIPQVFHPSTGVYCKAARVPHLKEIWLSLLDKNKKKFTVREIMDSFNKAAAPLIIEALEKQQ